MYQVVIKTWEREGGSTPLMSCFVVALLTDGAVLHRASIGDPPVDGSQDAAALDSAARDSAAQGNRPQVDEADEEGVPSAAPLSRYTVPVEVDEKALPRQRDHREA